MLKEVRVYEQGTGKLLQIYQIEVDDPVPSLHDKLVTLLVTKGVINDTEAGGVLRRIGL